MRVTSPITQSAAGAVPPPAHRMLAERICRDVAAGTEIVATRGADGGARAAIAALTGAELRQRGDFVLATSGAAQTPLELHRLLAAAAGLPPIVHAPTALLRLVRRETGACRLAILIDQADLLPISAARGLLLLTVAARSQDVQLSMLLFGGMGRWAGVDAAVEALPHAPAVVRHVIARAAAAVAPAARPLGAGAVGRQVRRGLTIGGAVAGLLLAWIAAEHPPSPSRGHAPTGVAPMPRDMALAAAQVLAAPMIVKLRDLPGRRVIAPPPDADAPIVDPIGGVAIARAAPLLLPAPVVVAEWQPTQPPPLAGIAAVVLAAVAAPIVPPVIAAPPAVIVPAAAAPPEGGPGLVLVAGPGDQLPSLYRQVYRGVHPPPPYQAVLAANPQPIRPGMLMVFPEPPAGWSTR